MDNKQAVQILYQAASQARLTAEEHNQVANAAKQLLNEVSPKEEKKDDKKK